MTVAQIKKTGWFLTRPKPVQEMILKWWDQQFDVEGVRHMFFGVAEHEDGTCGLWVTPVSPDADYKKAMASKVLICPCCLKKAHKAEV